MRIPALTRAFSTLSVCVLLSGAAHADILTFDFTGRLTIADSGGGVIGYQPLDASLTYDTANGIGTSALSMSSDSLFFGYPFLLHDITMSLQAGSNMIIGQVLVDWNNNNDMPAHVEWDATGLLNAIDYGLQVGDKLSGTNLYRDANGDNVWEASEWVMDIDSATPYSDLLQVPEWSNTSPQGPAPLAATSGSLGLGDDTPFPGIRAYFDIGSGNSMYVTSVTAVPVPAAAWLLGSGFIGLLCLVRRRSARV